MRQCLRAVLGVTLAIVATGLLLRGFVAAEDFLPERLSGHGALRLDVSSQAESGEEPQRPWTIDVHRTTPTAWEGHIRTLGKDGPEDGLVRSEVSWPAINGVVVDSSGGQIATFEGTISLTDGITGEFTTAEGETGSWWFNWP